MSMCETRAETRLAPFQAASGQLALVLALPKTEINRDCAIHRFEFTFELFWKVLRDHCRLHGVEANSLRSCLREAFRIGLLQEDSISMSMLAARDKTAYLYEEAMADAIHQDLPEFAKAMDAVVEAIRAEFASE
jgi:nucleotidyltransferase substrate binding protein (TIGR01987 family)